MMNREAVCACRDSPSEGPAADSPSRRATEKSKLRYGQGKHDRERSILADDGATTRRSRPLAASINTLHQSLPFSALHSSAGARKRALLSRLHSRDVISLILQKGKN